ncbi:maleylpyruvate isomerase N-terminal domain-containing protein [Streptantibioticus rubrisoli]|uniref:Maleylpyruvate isomerase N-terminal domain-containing protein n=1 Tax=Streptantibioticus rubrisoli TaxID=1387313 RepID=A0ABT1PEE1_9ACTN|nr:maleylpyruvate isomerase N-terminal domain-containing protein [Streptantibioticus rubrisoli]MCQ4043727.1 maleylpyruvate isomerase N-terminal domain-containing protein [Streptantibioticus rubrisoli]
MSGFDPGAEHAKCRAALRVTIARLARLLREISDQDAPSGVPIWTVGDVAAHLGTVYLAFCSALTGEFEDWAGILPPDEGTFGDRLAALNASAVRLFDRDERRRLADFVAERGETFLRVTEGLGPDAPFAAPWYGQGTVLTLATATGLLLSESLLHGLDITRRSKLAWAIESDHARLVLGQVMPTMMPLTLDASRARGVNVAYDVVIRGGPRLAVVIDGGAATVVRDAPPRAYDCRISATPLAFLLVAFRRTPAWKPLVRGQMRAGGRRPWLAPRLTRLITSP